MDTSTVAEPPCSGHMAFLDEAAKDIALMKYRKLAVGRQQLYVSHIARLGWLECRIGSLSASLGRLT